MRAVFYCNYAIGVGHLVRTQAIALELKRRGASVTIVSGGPAVPQLPTSKGIKVVQLPSVQISSGSRKLESLRGTSVTKELIQRRCILIGSLLADLQPEIFVAEHFPFGRQELASEILPVLEQLRPLRDLRRIHVVSSVRDLLVIAGGAEVVQQRVWNRIERFFDAVLVHADHSVFNFESQFTVRPPNCQIKYTGYVVEANDEITSQMTPEASWLLERKKLDEYLIVVSVGGGREGGALIEAFIRAFRSIGGANISALVLAGPLGGSYTLHSELASHPFRSRIRIAQAVPRLASVLSLCDLSVSHCGYNTAALLMSIGCDGIVVPELHFGSEEQLRRGQFLEGLGVATLIKPGEFSENKLAEEIMQKFRRPRGKRRLGINMEGAENTADYLLDLMTRRN